VANELVDEDKKKKKEVVLFKVDFGKNIWFGWLELSRLFDKENGIQIVLLQNKLRLVIIIIITITNNSTILDITKLMLYAKYKKMKSKLLWSNTTYKTR
jgi:hypothetical protein